jgi:flagellar basal-body rod protein FlgB
MLLDKILFSDRTPKLLKKTVDLNLQKNSVISSNIANADTPGYKEPLTLSLVNSYRPQ